MKESNPLVQLLIPGPLKRRIDRRARDLGVSRSEFIRRACEERLNGTSEAAMELQYLKGMLDDPESSAAAESSVRMAAKIKGWTW